jgi:ubiquinone biosynthesis protein COQ9
MTDAADWTRATEQQLLDEAIRLAPLEGWTARMTRLAGRGAGLSDGETELLLPRGPADLAALFSRRHDARALLMLQAVEPQSLKIRERIRSATEARLEAAAADGPAVRRWAGFLALPHHLPLAGRLLWESADALWRWAGDTATDENHYSKRAILSGILASGLAIRLTSGPDAAMPFVDARIANVMAYEKWKAGRAGGSLLTDIAAALGKMRYG